ncbi:MAG TPA: ribbon-helix-helix domain-containing protein [Sphingomonadaceae bacterium]|nr:ribbon-helix-helix domain-containing protein [Sphingomonadaceae bacterium]
MGGPVKRSVMIAGHATSISLEPIFWDALAEAAVVEAVPLNALVARIDATRAALPDPPNLASALRVWLFERARGAAGGCARRTESTQPVVPSDRSIKADAQKQSARCPP